MSYTTLTLDVRGHVAWIVLSRPDVLNAISREMMVDLSDALAEITANPSARVAVLTGTSRAFCAGADLGMLDDILYDSAQFAATQRQLNTVLQTLHDLPVPTVAMVNGLALAGGLELLLSCDMAIAAESARIGDQHLNFGLVGGPSMYRLPNRIGYQKAMELVCTGKWLTGAEAADCGLVLRAVPDEQLKDEVQTLVNTIADKAAEPLRVSKHLLQRAPAQGETDALEFITAYSAPYMRFADEPKEGVRAFKEKRAPRFD
jgi:enoyl-CoA hydratase/carnithine racemase